MAGDSPETTPPADWFRLDIVDLPFATIKESLLIWGKSSGREGGSTFGRGEDSWDLGDGSLYLSLLRKRPSFICELLSSMIAFRVSPFRTGVVTSLA